MSYLDIPRISFNGTFSTNPSTINNFSSNYYAFVEPDNFKNKPPTAFRDPANFPPGVPANGPSWNATGLAQFSFSGTVRGYVNANGQAISTGDSLIGATVKPFRIPNLYSPALRLKSSISIPINKFSPSSLGWWCK